VSNLWTPETKFILHGQFKNTTEEAKNWRPLAVASTMKDYLRRKELNRKVAVETIHCNTKDGLDVLVLPGKVRYTTVVPESVPDLIHRHVDGLGNVDSSESKLIEREE
jgi:hypothetical protein